MKGFKNLEKSTLILLEHDEDFTFTIDEDKMAKILTMVSTKFG